MGAFHLTVHAAGRADAAGETDRRATESLGRQGFPEPVRLETPFCTVVAAPKFQPDGLQLARSADGSFALLTGTPLIAGATGTRAARWLLERFDPGAPDWDRIRGHFCAVLYRGNDVLLFGDRLGIYRIYTDRDEGRFSSAFLAMCDTSERLDANAQAVYEYAFQGATYGGDTPFEQIRVAHPSGYYRINESTSFHPWGDEPEVVEAPGTAGDHVARCLENVRSVYRDIESAFGEGIDSGLSGGYDSRLTLALLRERGISPRLHVYGTRGSSDVAVALELARGEGLSIEHVDKTQIPGATVEAFAAVVETNFLALDGYPPDGVFDGGADVATRRQRCRSGELMLNGGGGEIFRDFFYLPDRPFHVRRFTQSFYSRFDPAWCTERFSQGRYIDALAGKLARSLGLEGEIASRPRIELAYSMFRCRYWMGKNNSNNNRFGRAMTPFMDWRTVLDAAAVPLRFKRCGELQSAMVREIDPALARYRSSYGHDFSVPAPRGRRMSEWATRLRPTILRRHTYRIKHRRAVAQPRYLRPEFLDRVLRPGLPALRPFFRPERVRDPAMYARICSLEFLFERYNAFDQQGAG